LRKEENEWDAAGEKDKDALIETLFESVSRKVSTGEVEDVRKGDEEAVEVEDNETEAECVREDGWVNVVKGAVKEEEHETLGATEIEGGGEVEVQAEFECEVVSRLKGEAVGLPMCCKKWEEKDTEGVSDGVNDWVSLEVLLGHREDRWDGVEKKEGPSKVGERLAVEHSVGDIQNEG